MLFLSAGECAIGGGFGFGGALRPEEMRRLANQPGVDFFTRTLQ